jgi:hypothetical protein
MFSVKFKGNFINWMLCYDWRPISRDRSRGGVLIPMAISLKAFESITPDDLNIQGTKAEVAELVSRLPAFTAALATVPASTSANYANVVESNNRAIVSYVRENAVECIGQSKITREIVNRICDPAQYSPKIATVSATPYTELLSLWGQFWSAFDVNFLRAVSVRTQQRIDLRDRYAGLQITPDEASAIEGDLRKTSFLKSQYSKQTGTQSYINGTTADQKRSDKLTLLNELRKASNLARIVDANVANVPPSVVFTQQFNFALNPKDAANAKAIDDAVLAYKNAQIVSWRGNKDGYRYSDHFIEG